MIEEKKESHHREQDVALSHTEEKDVRDNQSLNSVSLYAIVHREGLEELQRPFTSLWWSGVAAGMASRSLYSRKGSFITFLLTLPINLL